MLVVISILGLLAGLAVPAIKNLGKSNVNASAGRQLLDGVSRARQLALSQRTTVYMVFIPTNFWDYLPTGTTPTAAMTNLCDKQLSGYVFVTLRSVGDQPGQGEVQLRQVDEGIGARGLRAGFGWVCFVGHSRAAAGKCLGRDVEPGP